MFRLRFRCSFGLGLLRLLLRSGRSCLLGFLLLGGRGALVLVAIRRRPQGQVVTQELHDEGAVTVALLGEGVELSNSIIEGLLGKMASAIGGIQNLVVEDGEVESEAKADGVGRSEVGLGNIGGVLNSSADCS